MKLRIMHKLSSNVPPPQRVDSPEDSIHHVVLLFNEKSYYENAEEEQEHADWVKNQSGNQQIGYILANKPLMACLRKLMAFKHFQQAGKIPVTVYHEWSSNGTRGSVRGTIHEYFFYC